MGGEQTFCFFAKWGIVDVMSVDQPSQPFQLVSEFTPQGDQPKAIEKLVQGLQEGRRYQTLLGATGTGKTFTIAQTIARVNRPTLVIAHNKTLAAQLYSEFKA